MTQLQVPVQGPKTTTTQLMEALRASFGADEDATRISKFQGAPELFVEEVEAPGSNRRCDLLRIGLWKSRGAGLITVYELKTSRADWRKELDDPAKAEAWWPYCNEFYVVAPPGVVLPEELPPGWGLMVPPAGKSRSKRFRVAVKPERREAKLTPLLVAAIVARADNMRRAQIGQINDRHRAAKEEAVLDVRRQVGRVQLDPEARELLEQAEKLERLLGFKLADFAWGGEDPIKNAEPGEVADALRDYVNDHIATRRRIGRLENQAEQILPGLRKLMEQLEPMAAESGLARRRGRR